MADLLGVHPEDVVFWGLTTAKKIRPAAARTPTAPCGSAAP